MQSPSHHTGQPDVHTSDAATPGASVTAQRGGGNSVFDTPGPPSPGQASPARHRSLEGSRTQHREAAGGQQPSRGRSAGLEAAAAAVATADSAPQAAPEPLSKPRLRVQGTDIILEDAASPKVVAPVPAAAAAGGGGSSRQLAAAVAAAQQQQQQQGLHLALAARASQSHEHELQLRLASRGTTGASNMALPSGRATPAGAAQPLHADDRLRSPEGAAGLAGAGGEVGPSSGGAVEGPVRMKYRSTLTEENVAYLNKLDQYSRQDSTGRSSERIWRWLETSGPPFDNPPPSLGVPTASKGNLVAANRRQPGKRRGFLSCFNCFGGGQ